MSFILNSILKAMTIVIWDKHVILFFLHLCSFDILNMLDYEDHHYNRYDSDSLSESGAKSDIP